MSRTLTVEHLMTTAVISMTARHTLAEAQAQMRLAGIRHLPIVDDRNHVIGILSDRDLLRELGKSKRKDVRIAEVMTHNIRTVRPDTAAHEAAALLIEHKIGSLPVIGPDEQLVGLVTETDFLGVAHEA